MAGFLIAMIFVVLAGIISFATGLATPLLEILAGILAANLFNVGSNEVIHFLGEMGIISLMFLAGLEVNVEFIKKEIKSSFSIGLISFLAPFVGIFAVSYFVLQLSAVVASLVAVALSTTSVAIIYPILLRNGELSRIDKALLSGAMITDVLSIIALSFFFSDFSIYTIIVLAAIIIFASPIKKAGHWFFEKISKHRDAMTLKLKIVLLILLGLQASALLAGVEAVLLAFMFGVLTSELIEKFRVIEKQLKLVTFALLTPFFFFQVGLNFDASSILGSIWYLLLFVVCTYGFKFLGTYYATKQYFPKQAVFSGHLFNSALSVGIITATLGLEAEIITSQIFIAIIGTIIVCSFISTLMTKEKMTLEG